VIARLPDRTHWIIGTAGHIDHGKTALVKALTGQDTDRLKEEKERGISIDLGFASLELPGGARAGIVDVPGHERFIRNMLAGAHGMDVVLFTVAADDGVMPQTIEHLDILHLLRVTRAIFVMTKSDLATPERRQIVSHDIRRLTAETTLAGSPIIMCSAVTGEGLERLRNAIDEALQVRQPPAPNSYFRLPIDRAFSVAGHGAIATGTAISGEVHCGATVRRLPGNDLWRVRRIEVHNASVETAMRGQRIALNLAGSTRDPLKRGDVIVDAAITLTCDRFDARVEVRPAAPSGLKSHQRVRVYLGTSERLGTLVALGPRERPGGDHISPGETAYCQIRISPPLLAMRGDRFILRDETGQRTIGGGVVILAAAPIHKRTDPALPVTLDIFERGERAGAALISSLTDASGEFTIALSSLAQLLNRRDDEVRSRFDTLDGIHVFAGEGGIHYASEQACRYINSGLLDALKRWHADHPLLTGLDIEDARSALAATVQARIFRLLVAELVEQGSVVREGNLLRLPSHRILVPDVDAPVVAGIITMLGRTPLSPPDVKQIAEELAIDRRKVVELLRAMAKSGQIVCAAPEIYFLADCIDRIKAELIGELSARGEITTAAFRDRYHTSRKYAIPLLEYFDRTGVTTRIGEIRRLKQPRPEIR
jgi:selenocysteine-specific elongation factor